MVRWVFARCGSLVLVEAERAILDSLVSRISPYLQGEELRGERPCSVWMIEARRTSMSDRSVSHGSERLCYDDACVTVYPEEKVIKVAEATERLVVQRVIRLLRNLFRLLVAPEALFVHGGMIEVAGHGIAFLGPKYAGKTSSLLAVLTQAQASFIENDSLSLHMSSKVYGLGWFRSVYIRRDVLAVLAPVLSSKHIAFQHLQNRPEKPSLSPQEFATTFGCQLLARAELHALVFPGFLPREEEPAFSLTPLRGEESLRALRESLVPVPNEYHQFLRPYFPSYTEKAHLLERLVQHIPCYRLRQSFSMIAVAAQAICALAHVNGQNDTPPV
jgi:hypothetical protein